MPCKVEYSCRKHVVGSLIFHNLLINGRKWNLRQNAGTGGGYSEEEVIKKAEATHCREADLKLIGFDEDWVWDCE